MTDPVIVCRRCCGAIDAGDNYCRRCGLPTAEPAEPSSGAAPLRPWESPWVVLALLFVVLGPLALPLLWGSRAFSLPWKVVLTLLVTVLTAFLAWTVWISVQQTMASLSEVNKIMNMK